MNEKKLMDPQDFDQWSAKYDEDVKRSDDSNRYPFVAYEEILDEIQKEIQKLPGKKLLDLGFGTGKLSARLYQSGYNITGIDFSEEMIKKAQCLMPNAKLISFDFSQGLPKTLDEESFDGIIFTYSIHHLNLEQQIHLLNTLKHHLRPHGKIIIGDVMTRTQQEMNDAKEKHPDIWDDEEFYIVTEDLQARLPQDSIFFSKKSYCSGILILESPSNP